MNSDEVVLDVQMTAAPGREKDLEQVLMAMLEPTRAEAGCILYVLHEDMEQPGTFLFYEKFQNAAALEAHRSTAHYRKLTNYLEMHPEVLAERRLTTWRPLD